MRQATREARLGCVWMAAVLALGLWVCLAFAAGRAFAAAGSFDPGFAGDGVATIDSGSHEYANALALQPDGKLVVAGYAFAGAGGSDMAVYRLNPNGSLDAGFSGDGKVTIDSGYLERADALALQPDGKIVVAGGAGTPNIPGSSDAVVYRLNSNGSPDASFDTDGKATIDSGGNEVANALALQPDGKIVIAGTTAAGLGQPSDAAVYRLNPDGSPDASFGGEGKATIDGGGSEARALALGHNRAVEPPKIVVAGFTSAGATGGDATVYRLNPNGSLDPSFDTDGKTTIGTPGYEEANALALQPGGKIVVAGSAGGGMTGSDPAVYRLYADGSLDASFDTDGKATIDSVNGSANALALQPDGKIVAAAASIGAAVYRLNPDGSLDPTFDNDGKVGIDRSGLYDLSANAVVLQPDRRIIVAGDAIAGAIYNIDATVYRLFGDPFVLAVKKSGSGSVTSTPAGIACGPTCTRGFDVGTGLTLAATPAPDWRFAGWSGADCSGKGPCRLTVSGDKTVGAGFTPAAFGPDTLVRLRLARRRIPARGPLPIRVANRNDFTVRGKLSGQTVAKVAVSRRKRVKLRANSFRVRAHANKRVDLRLPRALRRRLERKHSLKLHLTATVKDPAAQTRTVKKRVTPKLKKRKR